MSTAPSANLQTLYVNPSLVYSSACVDNNTWKQKSMSDVMVDLREVMPIDDSGSPGSVHHPSSAPLLLQTPDT